MFLNGARPRYVNFICLNPSTATETVDDPTMRRCIKFGKMWGYDAMCVTNIFAFRSTDPKAMLNHPAPVGPDNDYYLEQIAANADMIVAAWSQHAGHLGRSLEVRKLLAGVGKPVHYLKMSAGGEPYHPLYLPDSIIPTLWVTINPNNAKSP